jgi:type I restriction enzyme, S subunit
MGQAPDGETYNTDGIGLPLIAGAGDFADDRPAPTKYTSKPTKVCKPGDIVLGIRASIGEKVIADREYCLGRGVAGLRPRAALESRYLWHWLNHTRPALARKAKGATFKQVNREDIGELPIELPDGREQRRIAAILDKADALLAKRRSTIAHIDAVINAIFNEMFGDPARNPQQWPLEPLGALATKFSDGPFGSNLKTEHYTDAGIRVIRLQNIGIGKFLDDDAAFISTDHFRRLQKHECVPGDVLIATLGDPNLRACVLPQTVERALNKADCVQMRVDYRLGDPEYLCALLNQPGTERLAQASMHGQTRVRISMGQLRQLKVPVPPLAIQKKFSTVIAHLRSTNQLQHSSLVELDVLFASLQRRAFRGEL